MRSNKLLFYLFSVLLIACGCANMVTPSGGSRDAISPSVLQYFPDTNSTHFDAEEIKIVFDEYIQLNDVFNQIIISPPLDGVPTYKIKGKTLTITLNSTLKDSTTYTINFGQAIKDNTEGNILNNFTYVFSTGAYLDSLQVSGNVKDVLTGAPADKTYVLLYFEPTDTSFTKIKPYYFAKTSKSGEFIIKNIRPGRYRLYALEDQNFNYYYDLPNEKIAFQDADIAIDSNISKQQLLLFSEANIKQNLQEIKSVRYGQTRMVFAKSASNVKIEYTGVEKGGGLLTHNLLNDTILFWHSDLAIDTQYFEIQYDTTLQIKKVFIKKINPDVVVSSLRNTVVTNVIPAKGKSAESPVDWDLGAPIKITFYNPINLIDTSLITVMEDSVLINKYQFQINETDKRTALITYNWLPEKIYHIILPAGCTKDIFGFTNDSIRINIQTKKPDAYATLTTSITNNTGSNILFQLLRPDFSIVLENKIPLSAFDNANNKYVVTINNLTPGIYKLRTIVDANNDNIWTTGNLKLKLLPERILFFPVDQNLRANWENEIEWVIN